MSDRRWHVLLEQRLSDCMSKRYDMAIIADTADDAISGVLARAYAAAAFSPALGYTVLHVIDFPMIANRPPPNPSPAQKIESCSTGCCSECEYYHGGGLKCSYHVTVDVYSTPASTCGAFKPHKKPIEPIPIGPAIRSQLIVVAKINEMIDRMNENE